MDQNVPWIHFWLPFYSCIFCIIELFLLANDCCIEAMQDIKILLDRTCQDHQISSYSTLLARQKLIWHPIKGLTECLSDIRHWACHVIPRDNLKDIYWMKRDLITYKYIYLYCSKGINQNRNVTKVLIIKKR